MIGDEILRTCNDAFPDVVWYVKMERGWSDNDWVRLTTGQIGGRHIVIRNELQPHPDKKTEDLHDRRTIPGFRVDIEDGEHHSGTDLLRTIVKTVQLSAGKATEISNIYAGTAKALREFEVEVMKQIKQ